MRIHSLIASAVMGLGLTTAVHAQGVVKPVVITFDGLEHGRIVNTQFITQGVSISADNFNRSFDLAAIFDSNRASDPNDPDLLFPWDRGNLSNPQTRLNNLLILAENNTGAGDGILDNPDDEGNRPAGEFTFDFTNGATSFGFDIVDIEGTMMEGGFLWFFSGGVQVGMVPFTAFESAASPYFDPTVDFGDNSANRIRPIEASDFGIFAFNRVVLRLGGSGAVDNITIPAPGAAGVLALAALASGRRRR